MRSKLLQVEPNGEPLRAVQLGIAVISVVAALLLGWAVRSALPAEATGAQIALTLLAMGAISGLASLMTLVLKIWQGGRVQWHGEAQR